MRGMELVFVGFVALLGLGFGVAASLAALARWIGRSVTAELDG